MITDLSSGNKEKLLNISVDKIGIKNTDNKQNISRINYIMEPSCDEVVSGIIPAYIFNSRLVRIKSRL